MLLRCGTCRECVVAKFRSEHFAAWVKGTASDSVVILLDTYPKATAPPLPEAMPPRVERYYNQGMNSFRARDFDAAGSMFRKCLESALRALNPEETKTRLYDRIENLPTEKGVTPSMREWAHKIRTLGNDAVHEDEEFSEEDATQLQSFAELFLVYTFSLPAKIAARRKPEDLL